MTSEMAEDHNELPSTDAIRNTSDDTLALEFADQGHKHIKFVGQWNRWMIWEGHKWVLDHKMRVYRNARLYIRSIAMGLQKSIYDRAVAEIPFKTDEKKRTELQTEIRSKARAKTKSMQSSSTLHSVVTLTRYDNRVASSTDDWDADPWVLNTPEGTVDLKTGMMRRADPFDCITKSTAVAPVYKGPPTRWLEFLKSIMHGDEEMISYLQKVFGYCLVGETKEHQMYFAYGTGANGKGVTLNTMRSLLGDYGVEAAIETFIINQGERHPTELADLRGARLVTCGETDIGQRWAEARIKMLTGGDPVKARFMRQDFFQYQPQFKLFLAGNHKPKLANVDEAIERRFRLIPFTYTVPKDKRDVDLGSKLREEWPSILAWAIDGCLRWQTEGLEPPAAVATATKSYLSQEDSVAAWYTECCEPDKETSFVYLADLYTSWTAWARANGEEVGTKRTLGRVLEDREPVMKIRKGKRNEGFGFYGLMLRAPLKSDD